MNLTVSGDSTIRRLRLRFDRSTLNVLGSGSLRIELNNVTVSEPETLRLDS
jgi:hypothetical protein